MQNRARQLEIATGTAMPIGGIVACAAEGLPQDATFCPGATMPDSAHLNGGAVALLDDSWQLLSEREFGTAMERLTLGLHDLRSGMEMTAWRDFTRETCRTHQLFLALQEDPLTQRSYAKPRGYSGDAVMLDMIYGNLKPDVSPDGVGAAVFEYTGIKGRSAQAVRWRRQYLAALIDDCAHDVQGARMLSIAAGHLREADLIEDVTKSRIAEWVAIDQDAESLDVCRKAYSDLPINAVVGTVRSILGRKLPLGQFDLIYSAGLFDYLPRPVASLLAQRMLEMCKPGGKIVIANFGDGFVDAGYMEAFTDWYLVYRGPSDLEDLFEAALRDNVVSVRLESDPLGSIHYSIATRLV